MERLTEIRTGAEKPSTTLALGGSIVLRSTSSLSDEEAIVISMSGSLIVWKTPKIVFESPSRSSKTTWSSITSLNKSPEDRFLAI